MNRENLELFDWEMGGEWEYEATIGLGGVEVGGKEETTKGGRREPWLVARRERPCRVTYSGIGRYMRVSGRY